MKKKVRQVRNVEKSFTKRDYFNTRICEDSIDFIPAMSKVAQSSDNITIEDRTVGEVTSLR